MTTQATAKPAGARRKRQAPSAKLKSESAGRQSGLALVANPRGGHMLALRAQLGVNRDVFARLLPISVRSLATIESGGSQSEAVVRRLTELDRVVEALSEVVDIAVAGEWLQTPNPAFKGLKPLEVIERGEIDRIWQMVYLLRSGAPS